MASNSFGNLFKITTWGESHGAAIGVVIDGCPAGLAITVEEINQALFMRAPGNSPYATSRKEPDIAQIYSGVFDGMTTGAPISIIIPNQDAHSGSYEPIKQLLRPGHANFTYLGKYGVFDYRGGGRASARETAGRVAASAVAKKLLAHYQIQTVAYLTSVGCVVANVQMDDMNQLQLKTKANPIFCPDEVAAKQMMDTILLAKDAGDSLGGVVAFMATGLPVGLGDPVYDKLEANLACAMLSIPASKGFEIGEGFRAASLFGSVHNDAFMVDNHTVKTATNHAGGTLGGVSTGMPLWGQVAFKPTSSINKEQKTVDINGNETTIKLPDGSRHDPCVAIRAVAVVDAMCALVLADALLMNRCAAL